MMSAANLPMPPVVLALSVGGAGVRFVPNSATVPVYCWWLNNSPMVGGLTRPWYCTAGLKAGIGMKVLPVMGSYRHFGAWQQGSLGSVSIRHDDGIFGYTGHLK